MLWERISFFLLGLVVGSFLNVVIFRLPRGKSLIFPSSFCPFCETKIKYYDNIPLLSYLILGGKCRTCKSKIPARYPLVEFLTGYLFFALYSLKGLSLELFALLIFLCILVCVSFIDIEFKLIPDVLSLGGLGAGLILSFFRNPHFHFKDSLYGAITGGGILFAIAYLYEILKKREGMGMGDVKLLSMIGSFLGTKGALFSLIAGSFFGSVVGFVLIGIKKKDLGYAIPFGPFLSLGAAIFVFYGDYLSWVVLRLIFRL